MKDILPKKKKRKNNKRKLNDESITLAKILLRLCLTTILKVVFSVLTPYLEVEGAEYEKLFLARFG